MKKNENTKELFRITIYQIGSEFSCTSSFESSRKFDKFVSVLSKKLVDLCLYNENEIDKEKGVEFFVTSQFDRISIYSGYVTPSQIDVFGGSKTCN